MYPTLRYLLFFILSGILIFSCNKQQKTTDSASKKDKLLIQFNALNDSMSVSWNDMIKRDDDKIFSLSRLIDEVSYNPKHDPSKVKLLKDLVNTLKTKRYSKESLSNISNVDSYDVYEDSVISQVFSFVKSTPDMANYPLHETLMTEINELNSNSLIRDRSRYSDFVRAYNTFIEKNKEKLEEKGKTNLSPLPSFYSE